jgi:release factor glutamine methyltransferase
MSIFVRNLTSSLLENATRSIIHPESKISVLELGCGDGNISRSLAIDFAKSRFWGSDISFEPISLGKALAERAGLKNIEFRTSDGLAAWVGHEFDVIVCDISAINQTIAELSDWYNGVKCETGNDGLKSIRPIIESVKNFLRPEGSFLLPSISLSNTAELERLLKSNFRSVALVASQDWPLPKTLSKGVLLSSVPNYGVDWHVKSKFGIDIANTGVFLCQT